MDGIVRPKGQITIPARLREETDLKVGTRVSFERQGGGIYVRPVEKVGIVGKAPTDAAEAFVSDEWVARIDQSIAEVDAGLGRVFDNEDDFLASLDE